MTRVKREPKSHQDHKLSKTKRRNTGSFKTNNKQLQQHESTLRIDQLPPEILMKVFGHVNAWHHRYIRETSRHFRDTYDSYLLHAFTAKLHSSMRMDPHSYESATLQVIKYGTEVYANAGFRSIFCGCLVRLMRENYKDPFKPNINQVVNFLLEFYYKVDNMLQPITRRSRLLFNIAVLRLLSKFEKKVITVNSNTDRHWSVCIRLLGPWFGVMRETGRVSSVLIALSEVLFYSICERSFKRIVNYHNTIIIVGNDLRDPKKSTLTLNFSVDSTRRICRLLRSSLEKDVVGFNWPRHWPRDLFKMMLTVQCHHTLTLRGAKIFQVESIPPQSSRTRKPKANRHK